MENNREERMRKDALNFLMFSYFGICKDDLKTPESIIQIAVEKAYEDATMMGAYKYKLGTYRNEDGTKNEDANKENKKNSDKAKESCLNFLINEKKVEDLVNSGSEEEYDRQHKEICEKLFKEHSEVKYKKYPKDGHHDDSEYICFTYGNAQKWVNMTTKNLYIIIGLCDLCGIENDELKPFAQKVIKASKWFHIPIDQIILRALKTKHKDDKDIFPDGDSVKIQYYRQEANGNTNYYLCSEREVPDHLKKQETVWSTIESYDLYVKIWGKIKALILTTGKAPIEWECKAWIKQSKTDKEKRLKT